MTVTITDDIQIEYNACAESPLYFADEFCMIFDVVAADWIPFHLWPAQARALNVIHQNQNTIILKARQIGMTWLALAYALWLMLFRPSATILLFSVGDNEAKALIKRLKGMYERLPEEWHEWLPTITIDNKKEMEFSNGSIAISLPSTAGDSYTATYVVFDEFDIVQDQGQLMRSAKPTIANGGKMTVLSRPDKNRPQTRFKKMFKAAMKGENNYTDVFLPWFVHPNRDDAWYEEQRRDIITATGSEDELYEQYPATVEQALAANYASLVYPTFSETENVSTEAEYNPAWPVYWGVDDGYVAGQGPGHTDYHPRVILLGQVTPQGYPYIFAEYWECGIADYNVTIDEVLGWGYPKPELASVDTSASTFRGMLSQRGISNIGATHKVGEGIKNLRRFICDGDGQRLLLIHPRCKNLIREIAAYKYDEKSTQSQSGERKPLKLDDHGPDALRYMLWRLRF